MHHGDNLVDRWSGVTVIPWWLGAISDLLQWVGWRGGKPRETVSTDNDSVDSHYWLLQPKESVTEAKQ